jgi:hypothetical protein
MIRTLGGSRKRVPWTWRGLVLSGLCLLLFLVPFFSRASAQQSATIPNAFSKIWYFSDIQKLVLGAGQPWNAKVDAIASQGIVVAPPAQAPPPLDQIGERGAVVGFLYTSQLLLVRGKYEIPPGAYTIVLRHAKNVWRLQYQGIEPKRYTRFSIDLGTVQPKTLVHSVSTPTVQWVSDRPCETWDSHMFC